MLNINKTYILIIADRQRLSKGNISDLIENINIKIKIYYR